MDLAARLQLLRAHGVHRFKDGNLEIEFESAKIADPVVPAIVDAPMPDNMPDELKHPEAMSFDKVLNWSASPDVADDSAPLPMTGDAPLASEAG